MRISVSLSRRLRSTLYLISTLCALQVLAREHRAEKVRAVRDRDILGVGDLRRRGADGRDVRKEVTLLLVMILEPPLALDDRGVIERAVAEHRDERLIGHLCRLAGGVGDDVDGGADLAGESDADRIRIAVVDDLWLIELGCDEFLVSQERADLRLVGGQTIARIKPALLEPQRSQVDGLCEAGDVDGDRRDVRRLVWRDVKGDADVILKLKRFALVRDLAFVIAALAHVIEDLVGARFERLVRDHRAGRDDVELEKQVVLGDLVAGHRADLDIDLLRLDLSLDVEVEIDASGGCRGCVDGHGIDALCVIESLDRVADLWRRINVADRLASDKSIFLDRLRIGLRAARESDGDARDRLLLKLILCGGVNRRRSARRRIREKAAAFSQVVSCYASFRYDHQFSRSVS